MSYRFLWKRIASKAISSALAQGLLAVNSEKLWEKLARLESLSTEQVLALQEEIELTLKQVEERGRRERDLLEQVVKEVAGQLLRRRGP